MGWDGICCPAPNDQWQHYLGEQTKSPHLLKWAVPKPPGKFYGTPATFGAGHTPEKGVSFQVYKYEDGHLITCTLIAIHPKEVWFKQMEETMGPYYFNCPLKWLDRYPPASSLGRGSASWREAVRAYHGEGGYKAAVAIVESTFRLT